MLKFHTQINILNLQIFHTILAWINISIFISSPLSLSLPLRISLLSWGYKNFRSTLYYIKYHPCHTGTLSTTVMFDYFMPTWLDKLTSIHSSFFNPITRPVSRLLRDLICHMEGSTIVAYACTCLLSRSGWMNLKPF